MFCGIGGFRLAMNSSQVECVFSSDNDKFAQQTYEANFHEVPTGDIKAVNEKDIPSFDILTAGFPCQPFSYAGEKQGFNDEVRGTLFFDVCRILEYHKPPMVFLENVKGLKSHDNGKTLQTVLDTLKKLGYYPHWTILSSLDYGLPQKRERWYCVAFRTEVDFEWPKPVKGHPVLRDIIDMNDRNPSLAIPKFELDRIDYHFANAKPGDRIQHDNSKYKPNTKKGKYGVFSFQKADGSLRFHVGDPAKTQIQEAFYSCLDTYASTIIANRTPKLWDIRRKLSVLESKRLQGFPDDFVFPVSDAQAYKQLGNSVSVPIIVTIMNNMIKTYEKLLKMKFISVKSVVEAYKGFQDCMTNKSWGYLALLKGCKSSICPSVPYEVNLDEVSSFLENIFNLSQAKNDTVVDVYCTLYSQINGINILMIKEDTLPISMM